jgi:hypothetical protein
MQKRVVTLLVLTVVAFGLFGTPAKADEKPIQLALFTPVQIFPESTPITGVRLSLIYGSNVKMSGLDVGLVNHIGEESSVGAQFGVVGIADGDYTGWQNNWVNICKEDFEGFQYGVVNSSYHASGLQLGVYNYARTLNGLQIGLINVIKQGGRFPVFPIVNWSVD